MILHYMSASRIKKFLQCPEQYHQSYENGVRGEAIHLTFGTTLHTVFERYYKDTDDFPIEDIYQEEWDKSNIADPEFYEDGWAIINNFLSMNDKGKHAPLGFELPFAIDIQSGTIYDTDNLDFSDREATKAFFKMLEEADAPIIFGFIDRLEYDIDNDSLRIVDYKTSRMPLTQDEADSDVQLSMYALVARYLFPDYEKVVSELQYVRLGVPVRTYRTDEQLDLFTAWLISIYYKIKEDTTHKATLNKYCGWCDAKAGCVAYQELINGEAEELQMAGLDANQLDDQLEKLAVHIKILEGRKKDIETAFKNYLKKTDNAGVRTNSGERFLTTNARINYDVSTIVKNFPNDFHTLLTPKKSEIDKLAKGNANLVNELEATGNKYFIEPTLRKRKN